MSQNQQEQSEAKLLAFIEGELDAAGRAEIEKHLEAHPQHRKLLEEMRGMRDWVRWLPKETAPAELAEAFQGRLERATLLGPPDDLASRAPMRINRWPQIRAAAAVAALAVGLGAAVFFALPGRHHSLAVVQPTSRPSNTVVALNAGPTSSTSKPDESNGEIPETPAPLAEGLDKGTAARGLGRPPTPASRPAEIALAKSLASDGAQKPVFDTPAAGSPGSAEGASAAKDRTLAESEQKPGEPTEQLARIARSTYSMVSADPRLIGMLGESYSAHSAPAPAAGPTASFGVAKSMKAAQTALPGTTQPALQEVKRAGRPIVMVVLAADTDRARKEIGDYLADNGISTQVVNGSTSSPQAVATGSTGSPQAASAQPPGAAGGASPSAAPAPVPTIVAAVGPQSVEQQSARRAMAPAAPAATPAPAAAGGKPQATTAPAAADELDMKLAVKDMSPDTHGDMLIARRMTASQAERLEAILRQPQAAQWAAVYRQPGSGSTLEELSGVPAVSLSNAAAVSEPKQPAVSASNPPAASASTPPSNGPAGSRFPATQPLARGDFDRARDKGGSTQAETLARKAASQPVARYSADLVAKPPGSEQRAVARGGATTQPSDGYRAAASPAAAAPPVAAAIADAVGGGQNQPERAATLRNERDILATSPIRPATQPGDEQAVDVVIVLQQSPGIATPTTQP